ncbi:hypothetical protein KIPB_011225, partial [Kipferlia bialata]
DVVMTDASMDRYQADAQDKILQIKRRIAKARAHGDPVSTLEAELKAEQMAYKAMVDSHNMLRQNQQYMRELEV